MTSSTIVAIFFASIFLLILLIEAVYLALTLFFNYYPYEIPAENIPVLSKKKKDKLNQYATNQYEVSYEMSDIIKTLREKDEKLKLMIEDLKFTNNYDIISKRLIKDLRKEINSEINMMLDKLTLYYKTPKNDFMGKQKYTFVKKNDQSFNIYENMEEEINRHLINIFKMEEEIGNID